MTGAGAVGDNDGANVSLKINYRKWSLVLSSDWRYWCLAVLTITPLIVALCSSFLYIGASMSTYSVLMLFNAGFWLNTFFLYFITIARAFLYAASLLIIPITAILLFIYAVCVTPILFFLKLVVPGYANFADGVLNN